VAFVRDHNIWLNSAPFNAEPAGALVQVTTAPAAPAAPAARGARGARGAHAALVQVTTDGTAGGVVRSGIPDWVYEEEVRLLLALALLLLVLLLLMVLVVVLLLVVLVVLLRLLQLLLLLPLLLILFGQVLSSAGAMYVSSAGASTKLAYIRFGT